jgi:hypothetical protein
VAAHVQGNQTVAVLQPGALVFELYGGLGAAVEQDHRRPSPRFNVVQPHAITGRDVAEVVISVCTP